MIYDTNTEMKYKNGGEGKTEEKRGLIRWAKWVDKDSCKSHVLSDGVCPQK